MTKVDEHAVVPPVDEPARRRLASALNRPGIVLALLFGSQATGTAGPLSDVDVAVWLDPGLDRAARRERQLELVEAAARALGTGGVELVILNDASPLLRHRAIRDGSGCSIVTHSLASGWTFGRCSNTWTLRRYGPRARHGSGG